MTRATLWPIVLIVIGCAMATMIVANLQSPLRAALSFGFFLICPGMAFIQLLRISDWLTELTLSVALSIALTTLASEVMILAGTWSSQWAGLWLIGFTLIGATVQLVRTFRAMKPAYREEGI